MSSRGAKNWEEAAKRVRAIMVMGDDDRSWLSDGMIAQVRNLWFSERGTDRVGRCQKPGIAKEGSHGRRISAPSL